ncbi:MAG: hypothetical protein ACHQDC_03265 [Acidimicrobiales bacterium]
MNVRRPDGGIPEPDRPRDPLTGSSSPADDVDRFVAEARVDQSVTERRRERWMRRQFADDATIPGLLLAAQGVHVVIGLVTGATVGGNVVWVGHDATELGTRTGPCWVPLDVIVTIETERALPGADPDGRHLHGSALADVITDLVADRAEVEVSLFGGDVVHGRVTAAGPVLTLSVDAPARLIHIATDAIVALRLRPG